MKLSQRHIPIVLVTLLLVSMFMLEATTAWQESQTIDEAVHLSAGLSYLKTGDFRMNPEHPPLIKELAALPLLFTNIHLPTESSTWQQWNQYQFGSEFLFQNHLSARTILFLGRLAIMLLSILLGWWIFRTSRELFGPWGGVLSVALYAFDPGFIAHGHYVTTDLGFTAFAFLSAVRLKKLLDAPTRRNALLFAVALWLAAMSKFAIIAYVATLVIILFVLKLREPRHVALSIKRNLKILFVTIPIVALITWAFYGFDIRRRMDDPRVKQLYEQRVDYLQKNDVKTGSALVRFVMTKVGDKGTSIGAWIDRTSTIAVPGYAFFRGAIAVVGHSIGGQESYLHGEFRDTGWWYYFPAAILIKTPLPTLGALLSINIVAVVWIFRQKKPGSSWFNVFRATNRTILLLTSIPVVYLLISMGSHLNLGWRHIMPIYPFIFVLAGSLASERVIHSVRIRVVVLGLMFFGMVATQVASYPNEIGYFNSFAGGSKNGPAWLIDSNLDWGQDLPKLSSWMKQRGLTALPFVYYGWAKVDDYLTQLHVPTTDQLARGESLHGFAAISIGQLYRRDQVYGWLKKHPPIAIIGSSIYLYNLP